MRRTTVTGTLAGLICVAEAEKTVVVTWPDETGRTWEAVF